MRYMWYSTEGDQKIKSTYVIGAKKEPREETFSQFREYLQRTGRWRTLRSELCCRGVARVWLPPLDSHTFIWGRLTEYGLDLSTTQIHRWWQAVTSMIKWQKTITSAFLVDSLSLLPRWNGSHVKELKVACGQSLIQHHSPQRGTESFQQPLCRSESHLFQSCFCCWDRDHNTIVWVIVLLLWWEIVPEETYGRKHNLKLTVSEG